VSARRDARRFDAEDPVELYDDRSFCFAWSLVWLRSWFDSPGLAPDEQYRFLMRQIDTVDGITSEYWGSPTAAGWTEAEDQTARRLGLKLGGLHTRSTLRSSRHHRGFVRSLTAASASAVAPWGFALGYDWQGGGHAVAMFLTGDPGSPARLFDSEHGETRVAANPDGSDFDAAIRLLVNQWSTHHRHIDVTGYTYRSVSV
jgi:hypothetical protein